MVKSDVWFSRVFALGPAWPEEASGLEGIAKLRYRRPAPALDSVSAAAGRQPGLGEFAQSPPFANDGAGALWTGSC